MRRYILFVLSLFLAPMILSAQNSIRVQAPNVVASDEQFNITFIIEGEKEASSFSWSEGSDFQLVWGPQKGRSSSTSIVNGKRTHSSQSTYTYVLLPKRTGNLTIPSASARIGGQTVSSSPTSIEVVENNASTSSSRQSSSSEQAASTGEISSDDLFLRFSVSRTNVVVGEPITATLKLYQRVGIAGFENARFPQFTGFWSQETFAPQQVEFKRESVDGVIYETALLRSYTLIPQQTGKLSIEPSELVCLVNVRTPRGRSNSIFDSFFDEGYRTVRKRVVSSGVTVNVSRLPAGAPDSFYGGVGSFSITGALSKNELKAHDAASLILTVSGKGNISLLEAPKLDFPPDFDVYDVKTSDRTDKSGGHVSGSKVFEYPFIPRSHGEFVLPPVKYSYYDTASGRYVTVSTDSLRVNVQKGVETEGDAASFRPSVPTVNRKDVKSLGEDIRFISTSVPAFMKKGTFFVGSPLFLALTVLILLLCVCFCLVYRRMEQRRADVAGSKKRQASKMARKRLSRAGSYLNDNLYTAFYEELHKTLLGFISDKLNMDSTDMTKDNIASSLIASGVSDTLASSFTELLDACEYARYAPDAGHQAMNAHYEAAVDVVSSIDSSMKKKGTVRTVATSAGGALLLLLLLFPSSAYAQAPQDVFAPSSASAQTASEQDKSSQDGCVSELSAPDAYAQAPQETSVQTASASAAELWLSGVEAYSNAQWDAAIGSWNSLSESGLESAELYYNLGNAFFKKSDYAHAVLFYERALKLNPSYKDARANLEFTNSFIQDRIETVPEFILKTWFRKLCWSMTSTVWAILFLVFFLFTCSLALLFLLAGGRRTRIWSFFSAIAALLLCVLTLSLSLWQKSDYETQDEAVVMAPVSSVKSAPGSESTKALFVLHEGTKVRVLESVGDSWKKIELSDGRQGWMKASEMELI